MSENRPQLTLVVAFAFIAGAAVGVAGTLMMTGSSSAPPSGAADAGGAPARVSAGVVATDTKGVPVQASTAAAAASSGAAPPLEGTGVYINESLVAQAKLDELKRAYGAAPPAAHYWYDPRSGLYGIWGHEAGGYIRPGHDFGPLPAEASNGTTGVFINGRQLNMNEAVYIRNTFGAVYEGRWWIDGTGNFGQEGNEAPLGNLVAALQAAQRSGGRGGGGGGYRWRDEINRSSGGAENGCVWINSPGSSYSSSGC